MNTQIQQRREEISLATLAGTHSEPGRVNALMEWAKTNCHLIAPATAVGALPEGVGIAMTSVAVDLATKGSGDFVKYVSGDVYQVGDKLGLSKTVLEKIGAGLGVTWDPSQSGRLDDGSDPRYVRWRAVGHYRAFDGAVITIVGEKEMDLRLRSAQVEALEERYRTSLAKFRAGGGKYEPKNPEGQIREMRLHIQAHAESKARLRALRSIGIKPAYTPEELRKPFVAARAMFSGQTRDPALRAMFAEKVADAFLGGVASMYGRQAPAATVALPRVAPPSIGEVADYDEETGDFIDAEPAQQQREQPPQQPSQQPAQSSAASHAPGSGGFAIPGGKSKGVPLAEASDSDLSYWANRIGDGLNQGTSRDEARDAALHAALTEEIARRAKDGDY